LTKKTRKKKVSLGLADWIIILFFVGLLILPDPVDALTLMIPILEALGLVLFLGIRINQLRKGGSEFEL
jgi:hypothetical protein